jgi:hypothetical protein
MTVEKPGSVDCGMAKPVVGGKETAGQASGIQEPGKPRLVNKAVEKRRARVLKTRPQVRKTFPPEPELRSLARSVMKRQIHPLIILPEDTILDGECRWRGLMLENPEFEVDVIVADRELTPVEICEMQMISSMLSTGLTAYEQALACKVWMDQNTGATISKLAEKIDRDASMVTRLNSLWTTIAPVVKAAEEAKIGPKAWYQISLLPQSEQPALLDLYIAKAPANQIAEFCRKKRASEAPAVKASKVKCVLPSKVTVVVSGEGVSLDESIDALAEAMREMKRARDLGYTAKTFAAAMKDRSQKN